MHERAIEVDVCIIGGGVAGLWTLARLRHDGRRVVLLEREALGAGQTIWSQGIIHGGIKYALTGESSAASRAIAAMPEVWSGCLSGRGTGDGTGVDLSSVRPLAREQHLWTTPGLVSKFAAAAASVVIRTRPERLERGSWPSEFAGAPRGIDVYRVAEPVLPGRAVIEALARGHESCIRKVEEVEAIDGSGGVCARLREGAMQVRSRLVVCAAGEGNEQLAALAGMRDAARMQRRALHMVMVRGPSTRLPRVFGHCLGASTTPRVTITTAECEGGAERVWYVGGSLAEEGVTRDEREQIAAARRELAACVPWVNLDGPDVRWATGRINRAEGLTPDGSRPDVPVVVRRGAVAIAWPTKLAFAPMLAREIASMSEAKPPESEAREGIQPTASASAAVPVAALPWESARWVG
ncbi:MAG: FAD-dependent oxidoreductase [Phycisphaerales bacterium]